MKGYSKIKGNNSFIQRSKSNKEFVFLDKDFDLLSSKSTNKKSHLVQEQESNIPDQININRKVGFLEKPEVIASFERDREEYDDGEKSGEVLKRNISISSANSSYQKNINNNSCLERQSSTRGIQNAVKRAFSMRRSSSVNSDRYCRIFDQPNMIFDDCDDCDYAHNNDVNGNYNDEDDFVRNGSLDTRHVSMIKKNTDHHHNHGRRHVGSKVVRACKRLFSR